MKKSLLCVVSFLLGAILFSSTPVKAAIEEFICYQADYKLIINGKEYTDPDLPLLNYKGYTIGSMRKILEFAGFDVNWNAELRTAEAIYVPQEETEVSENIINDNTTTDSTTTVDSTTTENNEESSTTDTNPTESTTNGNPDNIVLPSDDDDGGVIFPN